MKKFLLILICTVLCAIGVYAQESYTIKFANSANGATQIQTSTKATTFIASDSRNYVEASPVSAATAVYYGGTKTEDKNSIRFNGQSSQGNITLKIASGYQVKATKLILSCKKYASGDSNTTVTVNGATSGTISNATDFDNVEVALDGSLLQTIVIKNNNKGKYRFYLQSITVVYGSPEVEDIAVSYGSTAVTAEETVNVPIGTQFAIAAKNATSITVNGDKTDGAEAKYTATQNAEVNVTATDGTNEKTFKFGVTVYEVPTAPAISVDGAPAPAGAYYVGAKVLLTAEAQTAEIRYTLDSAEPTAETGDVYTGEGILLPVGETTVKAVAVVDGIASLVASDTYTVVKYNPAIAWPLESYEAVIGQSFESPVLTNDHGVKVEYTSSKEAVATIDADGVVTPLAMGTTVITATSAADETYLSTTATYTLKVTDPNVTSVTERIDRTTFGITSDAYNTYTYTSEETGVTYAICTKYNSDGMTLNNSGFGSKDVKPGFGISDNPNGMACKSITVKYSKTIAPSVKMLIVRNDETPYSMIMSTGSNSGFGHDYAWSEVSRIGETNLESITTPQSTSEPITYTFEDGDLSQFFCLLCTNAHYVEYFVIEWVKAAGPQVYVAEEDDNHILVKIDSEDYILHYKKINNNWNNHWGSEASKAPARVAQDTTGEPLADSEDWVSTGTNTITIDKTIADHQNRHYKFTAFHKDDTALANELNHVNFFIDGDGTLTGIEGIGAEAGADAPAEYYDLQGRRVANPVSGLYIRRTGSKVEKVFVK